jgi:membrane protease YdiL (CAAX protease family)
MGRRFNRALTAIVFAALWTAGMLLWSPSIDPQRIVIAAITGVIAGVLIYWLFDKFSGRFRR